MCLLIKQQLNMAKPRSPKEVTMRINRSSRKSSSPEWVFISQKQKVAKLYYTSSPFEYGEIGWQVVGTDIGNQLITGLFGKLSLLEMPWPVCCRIIHELRVLNNCRFRSLSNQGFFGADLSELFQVPLNSLCFKTLHRQVRNATFSKYPVCAELCDRM